MQPEQQLGQAMAACQKAWNEAKARMLRNPLSDEETVMLRNLDIRNATKLLNQVRQQLEQIATPK